MGAAIASGEQSARPTPGATCKESLAVAIRHVVTQNRWRQKDAAQHMRLSQPEVSELLRGNLKRFSIERLLNVLVTQLGCKVNMSIETP